MHGLYTQLNAETRVCVSQVCDLREQLDLATCEDRQYVPLGSAAVQNHEQCPALETCIKEQWTPLGD